MYGFVSCRGLSRVFHLFGAACAALSIASISFADDTAVPESIKGSSATHKQTKVVTVANPQAGEKLEGFCVDVKGNILVLLGASEQPQGGPQAFALPGELGAAKKTPKFACAVHVYSADGKLIGEWPVGFAGQAINTAPDGTVVIGGDGRVARFDAQGKKLHEAESPQMTYIDENRDEMLERAKEQLESDRAVYAEQAKQFEEQLHQVQEEKKKKAAKEKRPAVVETDEDQQAAEEEGAVELAEPDVQQLKQMVDIYKQQLRTLEKQTVEDVLKQVLARARRAHSIAASDKEVFVSVPAMAGYGFGVWRTDERFGDAKEIIASLSGCCGQMDVQCCNGELYVCENSRHRVVRYDRDGKEIGQFGKRDRTGEGENFGGCCNPMNLCFNKAGELFVSESNGVVKHFTPAGEYKGIVGVANVQPGCKNSCVGVTADEDRLFYIDIYKSQIVVLARTEAAGE
jgi:hypothetical protein